MLKNKKNNKYLSEKEIGVKTKNNFKKEKIEKRKEKEKGKAKRENRLKILVRYWDSVDMLRQ